MDFRARSLWCGRGWLHGVPLPESRGHRKGKGMATADRDRSQTLAGRAAKADGIPEPLMHIAEKKNERRSPVHQHPAKGNGPGFRALRDLGL